MVVAKKSPETSVPLISRASHQTDVPRNSSCFGSTGELRAATEIHRVDVLAPKQDPPNARHIVLGNCRRRQRPKQKQPRKRQERQRLLRKKGTRVERTRSVFCSGGDINFTLASTDLSIEVLPKSTEKVSPPNSLVLFLLSVSRTRLA